MDLKRPEKMVGQVTWLCFIGSKESLHYNVAFREIEAISLETHSKKKGYIHNPYLVYIAA